MYRITNKDALAKLQAVIVEQGAPALPLTEAGLIVLTPEQFTLCIEAARKGAVTEEQ